MVVWSISWEFANTKKASFNELNKERKGRRTIASQSHHHTSILLIAGNYCGKNSKLNWRWTLSSITGYDYCTESTKACWCIISSVLLDSLYAFSFFLLQCLQDHWQSLLLEHNFLSECTYNVTEIKCKTGNKFFSFPLASWLYLFLPPSFFFPSFSFPSYKLICLPLFNEASAVMCHDDDWDIIYSWIQLYNVNSL